jgi:hypothetical protein
MMLTRKVDNGSAKTHSSNHFVPQRRSNRTVARMVLSLRKNDVAEEDPRKAGKRENRFVLA